MTPLGLPGTDWGGDLPPRPGMRKTEKEKVSMLKVRTTDNPSILQHQNTKKFNPKIK